MNYSSPKFALLFVVTFALFSMARATANRFWILLLSSLLFYGWAGPIDLAIFLLVVIVSWSTSWLSCRHPARRRSFIALGIAIMAAHLCIWKYLPWVVAQLQTAWPGFLQGKNLRLPLPIGISFFTLQGIAYMVDLSRGKAKFMTFSKYLLFKSFFAQLIAGPIVRSHQLMPQLQQLRRPMIDDIALGLPLFVIGFGKKILIADRVAPWVDTVFSHPGEWTRMSLTIGLLSYAVQIWADFSGYTDMGRGCARMLGIRLPENFLSPYLARTPSEFWKRWHITLSDWIKDYIYIPLGGSQGTRWRTFGVVVLTMSLSGLWHGANWTFVLWGLYHGMLLALERNTSLRWTRLTGRALDAVRYILTLPAILFGWLLFRSANLTDLAIFVHGLIYGYGAKALGGHALSDAGLGFIACVGLHVILYRDLKQKHLIFFARAEEGLSGKISPRWASAAGLCAGAAIACLFVAGLIGRPPQPRPFIYFQF